MAKELMEMMGAKMAREREGGGVSRTEKYQHMRGRYIYSDEEIMTGLRWAAAKCDEPVMSSQYYMALAKANEHLPSLPTILDRFDTWNAALEAANLGVNPSRAQFYDRISEEDMLDAIRKCAADLKRRPGSRRTRGKVAKDLPSLTDYDRWRQDHKDAPSSVLIRKRLGGWLKAMEMLEQVPAA